VRCNWVWYTSIENLNFNWIDVDLLEYLLLVRSLALVSLENSDSLFNLRRNKIIKHNSETLTTGLLRNTFILKVYWWRAFPVLTLQKYPSEPLIVLKSVLSWYFHVCKVHNLLLKCKIENFWWHYFQNQSW